MSLLICPSRLLQGEKRGQATFSVEKLKKGGRLLFCRNKVHIAVVWIWFICRGLIYQAHRLNYKNKLCGFDSSCKEIVH